MAARRFVCFCLLVVMTTTIASAQIDQFSRGQTYFAQKKYDEAVNAFYSVVRTDRSNGMAWFWLGISRYFAGKHEAAMEALFKANQMNIYPAFTKYALARNFAATKEYHEAFVWLEQAVDAGYTDLKQLDSEEVFAPVRGGLEMEIIRRKIKRNVNPAEYDPRFRQMDFWIGDWNVYDTSGTLQGTNTITKELGGAVLVERWTNAFGISGMSINYFDPGSGKFRQQWVSQAGYNTAYEGGLVDSLMVMIGVNTDIKGVVSKNRMTFTPNPDGSVTQFIEAWNDSTQTWSQSFRGTYRRK